LHKSVWRPGSTWTRWGSLQDSPSSSRWTRKGRGRDREGNEVKGGKRDRLKGREEEMKGKEDVIPSFQIFWLRP